MTAQVQTPQIKTEEQQKAAPTSVLVRYILYYRQGSSPYPQFLFFDFHNPSGNFQAVYQRAQRHCEIMNYRFVSVRPALIDLDKEENYFLNKA